MERIIVYALVVANIVIGFIIFYSHPSPYGKKTYDKIKKR